MIRGIVRAQKKHVKIRKDALDTIFNKTDLDEWFNEVGLKKKKSERDRHKATKLHDKIEIFINFSFPVIEIG